MEGLVLTRDLLSAFGIDVKNEEMVGDGIVELLPTLYDRKFEAIEIIGPQKIKNIGRVLRAAREYDMLVTADADLYIGDIDDETMSQAKRGLSQAAEICRKYDIRPLTYNAQILENSVASTLNKANSRYRPDEDRKVFTAFVRELREIPMELREYLSPENSAFYTTGPRYPEEMKVLWGLTPAGITFDVAHAVVNGIQPIYYVVSCKVAKAHVSDNVVNFSEEQLFERYGRERVNDFIKSQDLSKYTFDQIVRRDWHLPAGTGSTPREGYQPVLNLPASTPVLHELKNIGLSLLGVNLKQVVESERDGIFYSIKSLS